ncbi:VTT domain-containing protein [Rhodoplanes sp. TEM]|uniref:VTT domain-containing protein n=1 Tax=Rhodoplanes TaxID=29407 RepID=UPI002350E591|nr:MULTISPECIES: VTT domain-containing protein [Rhodoplanes]MDC7985662.1 VTT domain-containing protein [Rhodoplanes sp. TEM]MDQ0357858.1 putative membrane protein YdjX (TVP38/TMEM64 family) [Rhodoplanes tepidamans]
MPADPPTRRPLRRLVRLLPLIVAGGVALALVAGGWHREISMEGLIRHHARIEALAAAHAAPALVGFVSLYIVVAALAVPGAAVLTIAGGLLFGPLLGGLGTLVGATAGATLLFLAARTALGGWLVARAGRRAARIAAGLRRDAFGYLLVLRLVPVVPFWLVNLVAAVAGVALRPFLAATVLGIAPATFTFAFIGAGLDDGIRIQAARHAACRAAGTADCGVDFDLSAVLTPQLIAGLGALAVLALVPLVVRRRRLVAGDETTTAAPGPP